MTRQHAGLIDAAQRFGVMSLRLRVQAVERMLDLSCQLRSKARLETIAETKAPSAGEGCTSGAAINYNGARYLLTAAHCYQPGWSIYNA